ncbi:hypothetical protein KSF_090350 [Reticulibacter mediterranei]|uniref:HEAT repeat domain-containing protein n=1 Tax=Reticulibacter mediterranei TaxID=2778369 RepID=A0A8J3N972_9CHLR|nr:HEAT repeat domain-containing protein [Reticulibacter mediterranei]GHO98987.1 hypothetical protein KSF_090350 [Reticulibacter mediterranei]
MEYENHPFDPKHLPERQDEHQGTHPSPSSERSQPVDPILSRLRARFGLDESYLPENPSIPALLAALKHSDWRVRTAVARRLGSAGVGDEVRNALLSLLHDHIPAVRAAAVHALYALDDNIPEEPLLSLLRNDEEDDDVRIAAVQALSARGKRLSPSGATALSSTFHQEKQNGMLRSAIIYTLGALGIRTPIPLLQEALQNDPDWMVREAAALMMGEQEERADSELLEELVDNEDEHPVVIEAIYQALGNLSRSQRERLERSEARIQVTTSGTFEKIEPAYKMPQRVGNVEFDGIAPGSSNLQDRIPVVVQALDNQWMPDSLLNKLLSKRITFDSIQHYLAGLVRTEYLRSLINGQQVIINRAYLYNNPVIVQDHQQPGPAREVFKQFLNEGVIVPFLIYEKSPDQRPAYGVLPSGFASWQQVCQDTHMQCLRFSWLDEETNQEEIKQFASGLHGFAQSDERLNISRLVRDLGLLPEQERDLQKTLRDIHTWSRQVFEQEGKWVNREDIYRRYITVGDPSQRVYDGSKEFAGTLKRLYDVAYNNNLAEALSGYLLTPPNSPTSLVLQDWRPQQNQKYIKASDIIDMLRGKVFEIVQSGLYLRSIGMLRLQDVKEIRKTDEWQAYIQSLQQLLKAPLEFANYANEVYRRYIMLAQVITRLIESRNTLTGGALTAEWIPTTSLLINVGGATTEIRWNSATDRPITNAAHQKTFLPKVRGGSAPVNIRLVIGDSGSPSKLQAGFDLIHGRMHNAQEQWIDLCDQLTKQIYLREFSLESPSTSAGSREISNLNAV